MKTNKISVSFDWCQPCLHHALHPFVFLRVVSADYHVVHWCAISQTRHHKAI